MGNTLPTDFYHSYTDEPHASRRKEILAKYPQVKELYGYDPKTKYVTTLWVVAQFIVMYNIRESSWGTILLVAYTWGAIANHALFLAMHEISHNLAYPKPWQNKVLGVFANITTGVPHFSFFQKYHMEHHQYQGVTGIDVDVPTAYEGLLFTNTLHKILFVIVMPLLYVIRPLMVKPKQPGFWEFVNWGVVIAVDLLLIYFFGIKTFGYFLLSSLLGSGLHPIAGHFIAEHYVFIKGQETYSYYGPLNFLVFNVGYHNEHHDFPRIPGSRLPQLREMVPEYYGDLTCHISWSKCIYEFITDPTVSPFSRIVRASNSKKAI
jgi:sphingolipid delta-4 desaturase